MQAIELHHSYSLKHVLEIRKSRQQLFRTADNKTIFVTHGNKDGSIENKQFGDRIGYDYIFYCFMDGIQIIWTTVLEVVKNGEKRIFFIMFEQKEFMKYYNNKENKIQACLQNWTE